MSTAHDVPRGEFWRPPMDANRVETPAEASASSCARCGTDYVVGSRFCHVCGSEREPQLSRSRVRVSQWLDIHRIEEALGLGVASLVAFIVGVVCTLAAIGTGLVFTANTVLDWQAVQIWRVEWLLAAIAAFVAGVLLKKHVVE
jgi:hypothetical protein